MDSFILAWIIGLSNDCPTKEICPGTSKDFELSKQRLSVVFSSLPSQFNFETDSSRISTLGTKKAWFPGSMTTPNCTLSGRGVLVTESYARTRRNLEKVLSLLVALTTSLYR